MDAREWDSVFQSTSMMADTDSWKLMNSKIPTKTISGVTLCHSILFGDIQPNMVTNQRKFKTRPKHRRLNCAFV